MSATQWDPILIVHRSVGKSPSCARLNQTPPSVTQFDHTLEKRTCLCERTKLIDKIGFPNLKIVDAQKAQVHFLLIVQSAGTQGNAKLERVVNRNW